MDSISALLGAGSGIDTKALVKQLVDAQFAFKNQTLENRRDTLGAQISAVAQLKSGIVSFAKALETLVTGGSLSSKAVSGDTSLFTVGTLAGAKVGTLSADLEVRQLAASQVATAAPVADAAAPIGTGTLTITLGTAAHTSGTLTGFTPDADKTPVAVAINATNNSLTGIAAAINAAGAGVTASVITDASGARLSIKGATGAESAFRIDVAEDSGAPGLAAFSFAPGAQSMTLSRAAQDAMVVLDGVQVSRASNSITDLIAGIRIDLVKAEPGRAASITAGRQTENLGQAVSDFVAAFNELKSILRTETDAETGILRGDVGARDMSHQMTALTSMVLANSAVTDAPKTLAEIGVQTNRDGSLTLNTERLNRVLSENPKAVEAMFDPVAGSSDVGLVKALDMIADRLTDKDQGLSASEARYMSLQKTVSADLGKTAEAAERMTERLTLQFTSMDARVSAYKATQSFLEQQIKIWTADR